MSRHLVPSLPLQTFLPKVLSNIHEYVIIKNTFKIISRELSHEPFIHRRWGRAWRSEAMNLLYIAVGGALGAVLRYLAGNAAVKYFNPQLPYGTFIINISGCFLMGLLMTLIVDKGLLPPVWRLFLCVGVLGGFTTFSSFGYEVYTLFAEGNLACALLYAALSCLLGVLAAAFGVLAVKILI